MSRVMIPQTPTNFRLLPVCRLASLLPQVVFFLALLRLLDHYADLNLPNVAPKKFPNPQTSGLVS